MNIKTSIVNQGAGWQRKRSWLSLLLFTVGAFSTLDFSFVGRVTVAEVIVFASAPYFWLTKNESWMNGNLVKCLWILILMFLGVIIGDLVNQTPFFFSLRALARPVFVLGFLLFFIAVLRRDPLSLVYMIYGRVIAGVIKYIRPSSFEAEGAFWDVLSYEGIVFRVQPLVTAIAIAIAVFIYPYSRLAAVVSFLGGGVAVVVAGGSRSSILVWLVAAATIAVAWLFKSSRSRLIKLTKGRVSFLLMMAVLALTIGYLAYIYSAPRGYLGEAQRIKMEQQSNTVFGASPVGFLLAGRPQVYGAILGIIDRPIFGFGSWRQDLTSTYVIEAFASTGTDPKMMESIRQGAKVGGAGHSVFFQAWLENGLLLAIAYFAAFVIIIRVFLFNITYENRLTPYIIITTIGFVWSFLFSPPGIELRFTLGLFMALYVVFMDRRKPLSHVAVLP